MQRSCEVEGVACGFPAGFIARVEDDDLGVRPAPYVFKPRATVTIIGVNLLVWLVVTY